MKKLSKSAELLWALGIILIALGVAICSKANLGISMIAAPAFVIQEAIGSLWSGFSVGMIEYIFQGVLIAVLCVCVQRFNWRYLLAFAVAVIYGCVLDLFMWVLGPVSFDAVWLRWIMLLVGDIVTAFGVACFFRTYMPAQVYEIFVSEMSRRYRIGIPKMKLAFDLTLLALSIALAFLLFGDAGEFDWSTIAYASFHSIGLGTLFTAVVNSPFITLAGKLLDKIFDPAPLFPKLERVLKRD